MGINGVYYIALGEGIYSHIYKSIESVRKHTDLPIAIATNFAGMAEDVRADRIMRIPNEVPGMEGRPAYPDQGYFSKVFWMSSSPWDNTIFLDHDTYITGDIRPAFGMLERFDIAAAPDHRQSTAAKSVPSPSIIYNTGVILYSKSDVTNSFMSSWWKRMKDCDSAWGDQPSFLEAIWECPELRVGTMKREWNFRYIFPNIAYGNVMILHGRGDDLSKIANAVNRYDGDYERVWYLDRTLLKYDIGSGTIVSC